MKKKVILIIVPILIIVILASVFAILYFTTDLFKTNETLFWKYFAQNENLINILANDKFEMQSQFKKNNSYTAKGNLSVNVEQGENSFKQLEAETNARHDAVSGRTYADAILKNGDIDLFKVSYINSGDIYAIKCDEVFANYVGIRNSGLTELASIYGIENTNNIPDSINLEDYSTLFNITNEQKQHIIDTYLPIILGNITDAQYLKTREQIQVSGISYDVNVYAVQLTGENIKQIVLNCLNTLKLDTETLILISNKLSTLGFGIEYTDTTNLSLKIDELISQIQQLTYKDNFSINVYENNEKTIRTIIQVGNVMEITYDKASDNDTLTVDIHQVGTTAIEIENTNTNETFDLSNQKNNASITSRIIIDKTTENNLTTNSIQVVPDLSDEKLNLNIEISASSVQNDNINSSYKIMLNNVVGDNAEVTTINYTTNAIRADKVEEIEELTNSNTAIANNYSSQEFSTFMTNWVTIFNEKLVEKLSVIGFDI